MKHFYAHCQYSHEHHRFIEKNFTAEDDKTAKEISNKMRDDNLCNVMLYRFRDTGYSNLTNTAGNWELIG